jgi:serine/threonine protein kinase
MDHPNLPVIYELFKLDQENQEFYMVLQYYQGGSLEEVLQLINVSPAFRSLTEQQSINVV